MWLAFSASVVLWIVDGQAPAQDEFLMTEQQFDSWLMSGSNLRNTPPEKQLQTQLTQRLKEIDRLCHLSGAQAEKLELAGSGDIARFVRRVAAVRKQVVGRRFDNNEIGTLYQEKIQPLSQAWQKGLFDDESLFTKVLAGELNPEQQELYEGANEQRRRRQQEAAMGLFIAKLERSVPMTDEQRRAVLECFKSNIKPSDGVPNQQYAMYVSMYQFSELPADELEEIFDEKQFEAIKKARQQGKAYKQWIKQQGWLE